VLAAEAAMDTQPWDYWQAGGVQPKGRGEYIVERLEAVLKRNPNHPGAIHLYIHAVEASTRPERALAPARRLAALTPGAGHLVHMPAHIYFRIGMYRESLAANVRAVKVDERYFGTSPSDPLYRSAYYPHNIHFVMVSAQMGGDGRTALDAARRLDAAVPEAVARDFVILQPIKAAPYATHALFGAPESVLALPAPPRELALVRAMHHYARALAFVKLSDAAKAGAEIDAIAALERDADFKPYEPWGVPAKQVLQTARLVAGARLADSQGRLDDAARAYEQAVAIEDALPYTEPAYWYYPVRQSLGAAYLRQGRYDDARKVLRESLSRVPNDGWALAALAEVERKSGDAGAEARVRQVYRKAWFGPPEGPDLARL
jgi:tetratricopeptide (TPR) repeat protein